MGDMDVNGRRVENVPEFIYLGSAQSPVRIRGVGVLMVLESVKISLAGGYFTSLQQIIAFFSYKFQRRFFVLDDV